MHEKQNWDTAPVGALVLRLGLPAMLAQFFNILYSVVDRIFVGHIADYGALGLASIGVCAPALTAVTAFSTLVATGGGALFSIGLGRRDEDASRRAMYTSLWLLVGAAAVLTPLLLLFSRPLLFRLGCSDAMYPYARSYFRVYVLGTLFSLVGAGMNQFILAQGYAREGMLSILIGALTNTVLDPILIFGFHLGIAGAALATITAQAAVMVYVLLFLRGKRRKIPLRLSLPGVSTARRIVSIGLLPFFIILLDNLLIMLLNGALRRYGGTQGDSLISCSAVVQSFMVLAYYPSQGITNGCGTLFGYFYGSGNYRKVMAMFRWVLIVCGSFMALLTLLSQLFAPRFAALFVEDAALLPLAAGCIRKYAAGLLGVGVQYAFVEGLNAMGQTRYALPISFFRKGLYVVFVLVLPLLLPIEDVFFSAALSDALGAAVTLAVFALHIAPGLKKQLCA